MNFNLIISGGLSHSNAVSSGLQFAKAALQAGHRIEGVFFYGSAVEVANELVAGLSDELDLGQQWAALSEQFGISLSVCVSASERRGVMNPEQATQAGKPVANMRSEFAIVGLGVLQEQALSSDRCVSFR